MSAAGEFSAKVRIDGRDTDAYGLQAVAGRVVATLGNNVTAELLCVSEDLLGRWITGADRPSADTTSKLADLDTLCGHLLTTFTPGQAALWLDGHDPYLRARPIDVYVREGSARLIEAVNSFKQGAFT